MAFIDVFKSLLPRARAWSLTVNKQLRQFFVGLGGSPQDAVDFVDLIHEDLYPDTTRELAEWELQFGLAEASTDPLRRLAVDAAWKAQGDQDPDYIQTTVQAAGFTTLFIHEFWTGPNVAPRTVKDPRNYTVQPLIGSVQCTPAAFPADQPQCSNLPGSQPLCNGFLANDVGYLVNEKLTFEPPPRVPGDSMKWRYFLYFGGASFPDRVSISLSQRRTLEELVLKLCPTQQWIVMMVDYDPGEGIFDASFDGTFN